MRFSIEDERAFSARRDELGDRFARWLNAQKVPGDRNDAGLLMDWKFGYGDGALDTWTAADVGEFLFGWCPRKLSAAPDGSATSGPAVSSSAPIRVWPRCSPRTARCAGCAPGSVSGT